MQEYLSKEALIDAVKKTYALFDKEFDAVPEQKLNVRCPEVDRTPQEMLAYQLGWLQLVMGWEQDEADGKTVVTPSPGYKWNQLGPLYQHFYAEYNGYSLQELRELLSGSVEKWCNWVDRLSDKELFTPNIRKWTVTNANWPLWKWIHINSVAPFKTFRTKIRKWKKHVCSVG
ncbi:ClbS/DfsB family four-helix bundle protein|uniref:ClbS/DfsB family four-helix bundle protein n=1 Tax=Dendrosporobacter quercicolus TaxID=146817 RepID=A0A1G9UVX0_9FIRM|nr:ClbS/DfsB family four-helix bundle protein [Dendrosporobacter quercicolus DSM 1736]SDM63986.1 hypothetical protein SAMN04488502_10682 [Dendrosporobacter quercicolus]